MKEEKIKAKGNRSLTGFTPTFPVSSFRSEANHPSLLTGLLSYKLIPSSLLSAIKFPKFQ